MIRFMAFSGLADEFLKDGHSMVLKRSYKSKTSNVFCEESNVCKAIGKVERWLFKNVKIIEKASKRLTSSIDWYNHGPHGSLDLDTPEQAFWQRLWPFVLGTAV